MCWFVVYICAACFAVLLWLLLGLILCFLVQLWWWFACWTGLWVWLVVLVFCFALVTFDLVSDDLLYLVGVVSLCFVVCLAWLV